MFFVASLPAGCGSRPGLDAMDAQVDASPPMPCGNDEWTEPGSPWPMYMGCPERRSRSAAVGPATPDNIRYLGEVYHHSETEEWYLDSMSLDGPVIASDGTLYIGSSLLNYSDYRYIHWSQQILAIDPDDGAERLIYEAELIKVDHVLKEVPGSPPEGLTISPDGHIYFPVTSKDPESGYEYKIISAFDKEGGEVFQSRRYIYWHKILGPDGVFYVNEHVTGDNKYLVALAHDSTELWRFDTGNRFASSIAIDPQGRIYFFLPNYGYAHNYVSLLALQSDGSLLWEKRVADFIFRTIGLGADDYCRISIGDNGNLYFFAGEINDDPSGSLVYSLYAYSPDGDFLWSHPVDSTPGISVAIGPGGMVVGGTEKAVYAFSPDGKLLWVFEAEGEFFSHGGGRPAIDGEGTTYIGMYDGLHAIRRDGTLKWKAEVGGAILLSVVIGADGTLYLSCGDKGLCVIEH